MQRIVFINSHPIQYFVPLYQQITRSKAESIELTVLYLTDETVAGYHDQQFGSRVQWDIPMMEGYRYKFLKNYSWKPSLYNGFFGLINWGLIGELRRMPKSIIISHGWSYASNLIAVIAGKVFGHTVCIRGDNPHSHEQFKNSFKRFISRLFLRLILFKFVDKLLPVGRQNRKLYRSLGISDSSMIFVPHAVDNARFQKQYLDSSGEDTAIRESLGLSGKQIILYVGKLINKKRPLDLLSAYKQVLITHPNSALLFVGDGILRAQLEEEISTNEFHDVHITGFVNQSQIAQYYTIANVFVMCSQQEETWGLSVNEAMNFALPIVASDLTGCADDLVESGVNGYVFPTGDVASLSEAITHCLDGRVNGQASLDRIHSYSYEAMIQGLKAIPFIS